MYDKKRYRQMLVVIEACQGGVMGNAIYSPGVLTLTAASPYENSFGANYDPDIDVWLADAFSFLFYDIARTTTDITLLNLYQELYFGINGSHVTAYVSQFGSSKDIRLNTFLSYD